MQSRVVDKWRRRADELANHISKWKKSLPELEKDSAEFRTAILDLYFKNEEQAVHELATIDALATVSIFLNILRDLKRDNDKKLEEFFFSKIGEKLEGEHVSINDKTPEVKEVIDHFEPRLLQEIAKSFENFLMSDKDAIGEGKTKTSFEKEDYDLLLTQLTHEVVQQKLSSYKDDLYEALCEAFPTKIVHLEQNKEELYKYLNMELFLLCAMRTYIGADNAQKLDGFMEELKFKLHYKHGTQLRKPFLALTYSMDGLEYPKDTNELWHEVQLYLKGFYYRVVLRDPNIPDEQDLRMKKYLHVSKLQMADYPWMLVKLITPHLLPKEVLRPERKATPALPFFARSPEREDEAREEHTSSRGLTAGPSA